MFVSHNADELFRSNMIENPTILYNRCKFKNFSKKKKKKKKGRKNGIPSREIFLHVIISRKN